MSKTSILILGLLMLSGLCFAADEKATESTTTTTTTTTEASTKSEAREEKAIRNHDDEDDDLVVIVAGAPVDDDDVVVVVADDAKQGRAIVVDGIPVNNARPNEAAFKLLNADDVKNDGDGGKVKIVDSIPTDNTDESTAGFRLPVGTKEEPQQRVIEVLVAEEEEDLTPGFKKASETEDDVIIIAVGSTDVLDCLAERETGTCDKSVESYFYDFENNKCQFFIYSGCGGNANRFSTLEECEKKCLDTKASGDKKKVCGSLAPACEEDCTLVQGEECLECSCKKVDPSVCSEAPGKRGVCRALLLQWTYNPEKNECETFTFGGCDAGASKNRFKTKELCQATCVN